MAGVVILAGITAVVLWMGDDPTFTVSNSEPTKNESGEFTANPFTPASSGPFPKLEIDSKEFDFGILEFPLVDGDDEDDEPDGGSHTFTLKNIGEAVLKLAKGPSTCQCTMADMQTDVIELPPGGVTTITVSWKPEMVADPFQKGASIWTNDPALFSDESDFKDGRLMLNVNGRVLDAVSVEPSTISIGSIAEKEPTSFESSIYAISNPDLSISVKSASTEYLSAEFEPIDKSELEEHSAASGWKVKGTLIPKMPIGKIHESLTLATNDPHVPEITIQVEAQRQGPIAIAGRYWDNTYTMVNFRRFQAAEGIRTTLSVYSTKQDEAIEVEVVKVSPEGLNVSVERDSEFADPDRERFLIHVEVPPGRAPERLAGKEAGRVEIATNIPDLPMFKFYLTYESR